MSKCGVSIVLLLIVSLMETQGKKYFVTYTPDDYVPVPDFDVAKWGGFYAMNSLFKPEFGIDTKIIEHDPPTRDPTLYDRESDDKKKEFVAGSQQRSPKRQSQSSSTLGSATHRLKSWWNSLSASSSSVKTENTREVDPRDDPRHYLESNEYDFRAHHKNVLVRISRNDFKTQILC